MVAQFCRGAIHYPMTCVKKPQFETGLASEPPSDDPWPAFQFARWRGSSGAAIFPPW